MRRLSPWPAAGAAACSPRGSCARSAPRRSATRRCCVRELILATNSTVEGEATAHFLGELAARRGIRASRIAHGVPVGGELEYVDGGTLAHALAGRQSVS